MVEKGFEILFGSGFGLLKRLVALRKSAKPVVVISFLLVLSLSGNGVFAKPNNEVMAWAPLSAAKLTATFSQVSFTYSNFSNQTTTVPLHHFDIPCGSCHGQQDPAEVSTSDRDMGVDINRSCSSFGCHNYDRTMNHPVGMTVDSKVPDFMPLDENSRMTCMTCHDQNISDGIEQNSPRTLQVSRDGDVCGSCHEAMNNDPDNSLHWQFSTRAHLGKINRNSAGDTQQVSLFGGIDAESQTCVTCHDDISVTTPGMHESQDQKQLRYQQMSDHPIGMEYAAVFSRDAGRYKNVHTEPGRVRLFDGKVGCGSCHSLYSKKKGHLITANDKSQLCRKCHLG